MSEFLKSVDPEVPLESGFRSATSLRLGLLYPVFALMADPQHEHHFVLFKQRVDNQMPLYRHDADRRGDLASQPGQAGMVGQETKTLVQFTLVAFRPSQPAMHDAITENAE